jgi:glutathione S-transferase
MAMHFYPEYAASRDALRAHVVKRLTWLSTQLTGPYLLGERFSVADAYLFVVLNWTQFSKLDLSPWPNLTDLMRRVASRPAVRAAMAAEGLVPSDDKGAYFRPRMAAE